jgi:SAM-dependent methyltransferase
VIEKERFGEGFVPVWVEREHEARYAFAAAFVHGVVLDCACGVGRGAKLFARNGADRVIALDASPGAARVATEHTDIAGAAASGVALPLRDASVDVYVSLETIEHVDDDVGFLREVRRVLRPGGVFICSTPNRTVSNPGLGADGQPINRHHVREYAREDFEALLRRFFGSIEMKGQNPVSRGFASLMERVATVLPPPIPARLLQVLKLPRFIYDRPSHHDVRSEDPRLLYEFAVAVCREPRRAEVG